MNILFLTLADFSSLQESNIYTDLLGEFLKHNHFVCAISPTEKRKKQPEKLEINDNFQILKLRIGNIQKTNIFEKGISTLAVQRQFIKGIVKYFSKIKFDLIIYSTPPITFQKAIKFVKQRDEAKTYLLLKDIFPQNALDLGILKTNGIMGLVFRYFRRKEKQLYESSDFIGCMSQANVDFILNNNPKLSPKKVEVCPNSIDPKLLIKNKRTIEKTRNKFRIPLEKTVFVYGGNLGKPQGVDFLLCCLESNKENCQIFIVIAGSGTESSKIRNFVNVSKPNNVMFLDYLPKNEFDELTAASDVGLIFLDDKFTIPNFPSRILSYMQAAIPVLASTDQHTDLRNVIEQEGFGLWSKSGDLKSFNQNMARMCLRDVREKMGERSRQVLEQNYTVQNSYKIIMNHFKA